MASSKSNGPKQIGDLLGGNFLAKLDPAGPAKATVAKRLGKSRADSQSITRQEAKLIEAGTMIATDPPGPDDWAYNHAILCQVGLPRAKVEGREFMRQSGAAWVNVQAGYLDEGKGAVLQPIPYGVIPRLALAWLATEAVRSKNREIRIGDSAAEFLETIGLDDAGRRYSMLRKQMHALAACRLQLGFRGETYNGQPVRRFSAWVANQDQQQRALWPGTLVLDQEYFDTLLESAVPLDRRALHSLKGSALALDVYAMLAHRLHRITGKGIRLHWASLRDQFGQEYGGKDADKDFKKKFLPALAKVQAVYPQAKIKSVRGGVLLLPSAPPMPYKGGPTR